MCVHEGPIRGAVRRVRETMPGGVSSGWPQSVSCITYAYTHRIFVCQAFEVGVSSGWPQSVSCITYYICIHTQHCFVSGFFSGCQLWLDCEACVRGSFFI